MSRLLLLILLVLGAIWWLGRRRTPRENNPPAPSQMPGKPTSQAMLRCAHCGLHLPQAEALKDAQGRAYCSEAHRGLGPAAGA